MIPDNDAMRALDRMSQGIIALVKQKVPCQETHDYETIRTALQRSAQVDNEVRIKVLKEIGFEYLPVKDETGALISHAIGHPDDKGFFVNHINLICAMQRIRIAIDVLARAKMKAQVDGLVKALEYYLQAGHKEDRRKASVMAKEVLQQFSAKEGSCAAANVEK